MDNKLSLCLKAYNVSGILGLITISIIKNLLTKNVARNIIYADFPIYCIFESTVVPLFGGRF